MGQIVSTTLSVLTKRSSNITLCQVVAVWMGDCRFQVATPEGLFDCLGERNFYLYKISIVDGRHDFKQFTLCKTEKTEQS